MQLRDDYPLGTIDHKGAVLGHQGHLAHVDVLFLDIAEDLRAARLTLVKDDQAQRGKKRSRVHHSALLTLTDIKNWGAKRITDKIQRGRAVITLDREY